MTNTISKELLTDIFEKLGRHRFFIVGSFTLAVLEYELLKTKTTTFNDIDILCLPSLRRHCMPLYEYFKNKYGVQLSFNFYSPQYLKVEEVIQESALFNIHRVLINVQEGKLIYDSSTFEDPLSLLTTYFTKDIQLNPDCCIYYYRKLEQNLKQFEKYNIPVTPEILKQLQKKILYTTDSEYIEYFYDSHTRYHKKPETIHVEKPSDYFLVYYPVQNKFTRSTFYLSLR